MADPDLKHELSVLAKLAIPLIIVGACDQFSKVLTTIFAGQYLSTKLFEAIAFGNSLTNITGLAVTLIDRVEGTHLHCIVPHPHCDIMDQYG